MEFTLAKQKSSELRDSPLSPNQSRLLGHESKGLVIISENISSARVMRGAIIVCPWRSVEVSIFIVLVYLQIHKYFIEIDEECSQTCSRIKYIRNS